MKDLKKYTGTMTLKLRSTFRCMLKMPPLSRSNSLYSEIHGQHPGNYRHKKNTSNTTSYIYVSEIMSNVSTVNCSLYYHRILVVRIYKYGNQPNLMPQSIKIT